MDARRVRNAVVEGFDSMEARPWQRRPLVMPFFVGQPDRGTQPKIAVSELKQRPILKPGAASLIQQYVISATTGLKCTLIPNAHSVQAIDQSVARQIEDLYSAAVPRLSNVGGYIIAPAIGKGGHKEEIRTFWGVRSAAVSKGSLVKEVSQLVMLRIEELHTQWEVLELSCECSTNTLLPIRRFSAVRGWQIVNVQQGPTGVRHRCSSCAFRHVSSHTRKRCTALARHCLRNAK